jgi:hypothetical protein
LDLSEEDVRSIATDPCELFEQVPFLFGTRPAIWRRWRRFQPCLFIMARAALPSMAEVRGTSGLAACRALAPVGFHDGDDQLVFVHGRAAMDIQTPGKVQEVAFGGVRINAFCRGISL